MKLFCRYGPRVVTADFSIFLKCIKSHCWRRWWREDPPLRPWECYGSCGHCINGNIWRSGMFRGLCQENKKHILGCFCYTYKDYFTVMSDSYSYFYLGWLCLKMSVVIFTTVITQHNFFLQLCFENVIVVLSNSTTGTKV